MSLEEILKDITKILVGDYVHTEDQVTPDTDIREGIGLDSLDVAELTMRIEDEFHIIIFDEEVELVTTVKDLAQLIQTKVNAKTKVQA